MMNKRVLFDNVYFCIVVLLLCMYRSNMDKELPFTMMCCEHPTFTSNKKLDIHTV